MGFEIVEPGHMQMMDPLPQGQASLAKSGKLCAHACDLQLAEIGKHAVVLADRESFRIALRAAREGDEGRTVAVSIVTASKSKRDSGRRGLNIGRAIRRLDLEPEKCAGRYELHHKGAGRDSLLILNLMPDTAAIGAGKSKPKGAAGSYTSCTQTRTKERRAGDCDASPPAEGEL